MAIDSVNFRSSEIDLSDKKFLIVDDFHEMRSIFRDIVRNIGVNSKNISVAGNGNDAIRLLSNKTFDVVLCDWNLGTGKNGQQVLEEAKLRNLVSSSCIWIMITAEKTSAAVAGAAEFQPDAYLIKPTTIAILRARIDRIWAKKEAFLEIHQAIKQNKYSEAISLCDQRLTYDKVNASELLRTKCDLLLDNGELDRAKKLLDSVLAKRDFSWAKASLAKILIKNNNLEEAKILLEDTLDENPTFLEAHDLLVKTLQTMGDLESTSMALERAAKLSPNSVVRQKQLGDIALKMGKLENAEKAFRKSVSLGEHSVLKTADAYIGLAKTCSANTNPVEALKVIGELNKQFSTKDVQLKSMAVEGLIHHQSGDKEKAKQIAVELSKHKTDNIDPDSERSLDMAKLFMATGDKQNAIALLQQEIKINPEDNILLEDANAIFVDAGMGEEGATLIETSRREAIEIMNGGVLLVSKGQYEEAVNAMRNARKAMPSNVRVLFNLAYVIITYIQKKGAEPVLVKEARESLNTANRLSPGESRYSKLMNALNQLSN